MKPADYFSNPTNPGQRQYEALKAFYCEKCSASDIESRFGFKDSYFKKLCLEFVKHLKEGLNPFFEKKKPGPKSRRTGIKTVEKIIVLRKQNASIADIKVMLHAGNESLSLDTIDKILKQEGFAPLPKRTKQERIKMRMSDKIPAPRSTQLTIKNEEFTTERAAGCLAFLPLLESLGIIDAIKKANFPRTEQLSDVQMVLSFLSLKLLGNQRWSHDTTWNMDRALGFFAGLNVLPKATTLSTYSYRITRESNYELLKQLSNIFKGDDEEGEFNLDFKAIPHWGDESVLEKNWNGARSKAMKSILSLIVQSPQSGFISYTDAELRHDNQNDAILDFVDFWKNGRGVAPKMLIFDSKLTTYQNLNKLDKSAEKIKFLTLRRRGKALLENTSKIPEKEWQYIAIERTKGKQQKMRVHDGKCKLRNYEGDVRQIILTDHGREKPTFLITNDFDLDVKHAIRKYARRWLVEQEIAEQIAFFHLNNPSSSIVVKVDFDLTISLLAHNLYHYMATKLPRFEQCTAKTIHRYFLDNGGKIVIENNTAHIYFKKKKHLPILMKLPWLQESTKLSWLGDVDLQFDTWTVT